MASNIKKNSVKKNSNTGTCQASDALKFPKQSNRPDSTQGTATTQPSSEAAAPGSTQENANGEAATAALLKPKLEPGLSSSVNRLPNFHAPRHLELSGLNISDSVKQTLLLSRGTKPKRVFVPNIPTRREKPGEAYVGGRSDQTRGQRGRGRGDRGRGQGRGRGRGKELLQTKGLFGEGVIPPLRGTSTGGSGGFGGRGGGGGFSRAFSGGGGGGGGGGSAPKAEDGAMQQPVVASGGMMVDKDFEDGRLEELLRDDFIAHEEDDTAEYYDQFCPPITYKVATPSVKLETNTAPGIKQEPDDSVELTNGHDVPSPSIKQESGVSQSLASAATSTASKKMLTPGEALTTLNDNFIFMQLPSTLPSIVNKESAVSDKNIMDVEDFFRRSQLCRLRDLPSGQIGTVKVYKSGRAELCLGEYILPIAMLRKQNFRQEVAHVSVDKGSQHGRIGVHGQVDQRMVVKYDFKSMLYQTRGGGVAGRGTRSPAYNDAADSNRQSNFR